MRLALGLVSSVAAVLACSAAGEDYHYFYNDQPVQITLDPSHVAIFHPDDAAAGKAGEVIERLGLQRSNSIGWARRSWSLIETPPDVVDEQGVRVWIEALRQQQGIGWVSPVFDDAYGPMTIKPDIV